MAGNGNVDMVRRRFEELDRGNFEILDELFAPEYRLRPGGASEALNLAETKNLYSLLYAMLPDLKHSLDEQLEDGDKVVTRWTATGTHRGEVLGVEPTGKSVSFSGINIYTIADGRFVGSDVSWDLLPVMTVLALAPEQPSLFHAARAGGEEAGSY
ncbi:MAG: hypothetical protein QOH00_322 [Gaiellales bacterium]|nr:hypothetical protein [Gaiellales bacterium]